MKMKQTIIKIGSMLLAIVLCILCTATSAFATETATQSKIAPALVGALTEFTDTELVPLSIWFYDIDESVIADNTIDAVDVLIEESELPSYSINTINQETAEIDAIDTDLSVEEIQLISNAKRNSVKELYEDYNMEKLRVITNQLSNYNVIYSCSYAPNVVIEIQKSEIDKIEYDAHIKNIYYYDEAVLNVDFTGETDTGLPVNIDMEDCRDFIESYDSLTGSGINVGMIETNMPDKEILALQASSDRITLNPDATTTVDRKHPSTVASVMVGECEEEGEEFCGIIPDANLYCTSTNVTGGGWKAGVEWLVGNGVNVINISTAIIVGDYSASNDLSRWIDHVSYQHNITVVTAVGYFATEYSDVNISPFVYSNNVIVVGAITLKIDENNNYYFQRYNTSLYSGSGRYYPQVVAPANPGYIPGYAPDPTQWLHGNSFSAPMVTSAVAQLMQLEPSLLTNPTLVKSLIMAGATGDKLSESTDTSGTDMDRELGAGVLNVRRSISCLSTASVPKTYTYNYSAGNLSQRSLSLNVTESGNIRLALNWQSKGMFDSEENHVEDEGMLTSSFSFFKLTVTSPSGEVYTSFDVQNPFQLLVFDAPSDDLGTYSVTISRHGVSGYETPISLAVYGADSLV